MRKLATVMAVVVSLFSHPVYSDITFEEVVLNSDVRYIGSSWSAGWRDYNNDGYVDLWTSNHGGKPLFYINNGDGSFRNGEVALANSVSRDGHGIAWADIDNDGDADLIEIVGAALGTRAENNLLYMNDGGKLTVSTNSSGLSYPLGRGRVPLWLDYDQDGLLDILIMNQSRKDNQAPSALFHNEYGHFLNSSLKAGLDINDTANDAFAALANIHGSLPMELMIFGSGPTKYSPKAYQINKDQFNEITEKIFPEKITDVFDAVTADFNGDLQTDIFLSRYKYTSNIVKMDDHYYRAGVFNNGAKNRGLDFVTDGDLTLSVHLPSIKWKFSDVVLGKNMLPAKTVNRKILSGTLSLSTADKTVYGEPLITETRKRGVYIWYDEKTTRWHIRFTSNSWAFLQLEIFGSEAIKSVTSFGFELSAPLQPKLLLSNNAGYDEKSLGKFPACPAAAAADFDNDMDVDLYLVCSEGISNTANLLLENTGNGKFKPVKFHGAEGTLKGIGNKAIIADYNNDGVLDIFVTNGLGIVSPINQGPNQLFQNKGNENHWLKIRLEGTISNRDGIGAEILLQAGKKTQLREQNGKSHYGAQDDIIIHFGMGTNKVAEKITVRWPSGIVQHLYGIKANQILHIIEQKPDK